MNELERMILKFLFDKNNEYQYYDIYEAFEGFDLSSIAFIVRDLRSKKLVKQEPLESLKPIFYGTEVMLDVNKQIEERRNKLFIRIQPVGRIYYEDKFTSQQPAIIHQNNTFNGDVADRGSTIHKGTNNYDYSVDNSSMDYKIQTTNQKSEKKNVLEVMSWIAEIAGSAIGLTQIRS